ncbi:MAG: glycosyltransferase family 9 protein [Armatimonadota bacterium]
MHFSRKIKERVSIIIPTFNGLELLKENLPHLLNAVYFTGGKHEIIVVDDGSKDGSVEYIKSRYPQIRTIKLPKNYGFARCCNIASRESKNSILIFLNNDIKVTRDFLQPLIEPFKEADLFALTPKIITERDNFIESIHETVFTSGYFCNKRVDSALIEKVKTLFPVSFATGACLAVDKEKFFALGGFDEIYHPYYWEDVDLSYRAWKRSWRVLYQPDSLVYHQRGATIGDGSRDPEVDKVFLRNMIFFTWKNLTDYKVLLKHFITLPFDLLFAVIGRRENYIEAFKKALPKIKEVIKKRKQQHKKLAYSDSEVLSFFKDSIEVLKKSADEKDIKMKETKAAQFEDMDDKESDIKKILVMHTHGGIGDLLLSTPIFSTLKMNYPDIHVTLIVDDMREEVVQGNPYIDEIITLDSEKIGTFGYFFKVLGMIKEGKYDAGIVLWSTAWEALAVYLAGVKIRVGQSGRLLYSFLYNYPVRISSETGDKTSHWVEIILDYVRALPVCEVDRNLFFEIPQQDKDDIKGLFEKLGIDKHKMIIALHTGKGMELDPSVWPTWKFAAIADMLVEKFKAVVILTGGPEETELVADVEKKMKYKAVNLAGHLSLKQLGAVLERCSLLICPDSGPMHIAAACKVPVVAIFGLKSDFPNRWHPYRTRYEIVRNFYINCDKVCVKEKCKKFICMEQIREDEILKACERLLKSDKFAYR